MRRLYLILAATVAAIHLVCSDKSTGPEEGMTDLELMKATLELQDSVGQRVVEWIGETDTTAALNSGYRALMKADRLVDTAYITSQGIAIKFKNGMHGGIMIDPRDGLPLNPETVQAIAPRQKISDGKPGSLKTLFYCPIYNERKQFADSIINSAEKSFRKVNYEPFSIRPGDEYFIGHFSDFNEYGLIYIYSFSFLWPEPSDSEIVYLMTGDDVSSALDYFTRHDLETNKIAAIYVSSKGNMYFIPPQRIGFEEEPGPAPPVIYLGFANSFKGDWPKQMEDEFGQGACIGYDGFPDAEHNLDWTNGFYEFMCDTTQSEQKTMAEWYASIEKSYEQNGIVTTILYDGQDEYGLWTKVIIDELSRTWGHPGDIVEIRGNGFGVGNVDSKVFIGHSEAPVISWSETVIDVYVPENAVSGDLYVKVRNVISNRFYFRIYPNFAITSIIPDSAAYGDTIQINGGGFTILYPNVYVGDILADGLVYWSDTLILAPVPEGPSLGDSEVKIEVASRWTDPFPFRIIPYANIASVTSGPVLYGDVVTYRGSRLGEYEGDESVFFQGLDGLLEGTILLWTDSLVQALVPEGSVSGSTFLQCGRFSGDLSNSQHIDVFGVVKLSPDMGFPGGAIKIIGSGFGETQGTGFVTFGDLEADVKSWSDTQIEVYVPQITEDCSVTVHVNGHVSSGAPFQLLAYNEVYSILQQCTNARASFSGYITERLGSTYDSRYRYYSYYGHNDSLWNAQVFQCGGFCDLDSWTDCLAAVGLMSTEGDLVDSVYGQNHFYQNIDMVWEITIWNRSFKLKDVPLISYQEGDTLRVTYELSGPDVKDHISDILIFKTYVYYGPDTLSSAPLNYAEEYYDTDWENIEYPPTIRVIFSNYPLWH